MGVANAYSSFSGIDIVAMVGNVAIGTLQGISYSITREKAPIYTTGSANPKSFSRGKRGIAGSMIFTLFDRSPLYGIFGSGTAGNDTQYWYYKKDGDPLTLDDAPNPFNTGVTNGQVSTKLTKPEFMDQVMPFNVTLIAANEYGLAAWKAIIGIEILNEGGGLSVDDITNEEQTTYVARSCTAWVPVAKKDSTNYFVAGLDANQASERTISSADSSGILQKYKTWLGVA